MPLSALFLLTMGAGGFLLYTAVKGEAGPAGGHPFTAFKDVITGNAVPGVNSAATAAVAGTNTTPGGANTASGGNNEATGNPTRVGNGESAA